MIERCGWAWVALVVVASACSREIASEPNAPKGPEFVPTVGGQSGQEGSCVEVGPRELPYDPEEVLGRVLGRHSTRIIWNDGKGKPQSATFEIERGDRGVVEVKGECGPAAFLDVTVRMLVPGAGVDVEFEALAQVVGYGDEVMVSTQLDGDFKSTLSAHAEEIARSAGVTWHVPAAATKHYFDLWWFDGKISGNLTTARDTEFCGMAIWPETYCDTHRIAFPQDEHIDGFDANMVLDMVRSYGEQLLTWQDGTVTHVQFDVAPADGPLCVGPYFSPRLEHRIRDGIEVQVPVTIHLKTSDGRLDTSVPGQVMPVISHSTGLQEVFSIEARLSGPRAAMEAAGVKAVSDSMANTLSVSFDLRLDSAKPDGVLNVFELDLAMPPSKLGPNLREQPLGLCSGAASTSVGLGTQLQGVIEVVAP